MRGGRDALMGEGNILRGIISSERRREVLLVSLASSSWMIGTTERCGKSLLRNLARNMYLLQSDYHDVWLDCHVKHPDVSSVQKVVSESRSVMSLLDNLLHAIVICDNDQWKQLLIYTKSHTPSKSNSPGKAE